MSGPARRGGPALPLARGLALLVAAGCFAAIVWSARERPEGPMRPPAAAAGAPPAAAALARPAPAAGGEAACRERKRAEIAAIEATGSLGAEQRMRIRQIEARACE
jgi:hypothetical protein